MSISGNLEIHGVSAAVVCFHSLLWNMRRGCQSILWTHSHASVRWIERWRPDCCSCRIRLTSHSHSVMTVLPRVCQVTMSEDTSNSTESTNEFLRCDAWWGGCDIGWCVVWSRKRALRSEYPLALWHHARLDHLICVALPILAPSLLCLRHWLGTMTFPIRDELLIELLLFRILNQHLVLLQLKLLVYLRDYPYARWRVWILYHFLSILIQIVCELGTCHGACSCQTSEILHIACTCHRTLFFVLGGRGLRAPSCTHQLILVILRLHLLLYCACRGRRIKSSQLSIRFRSLKNLIIRHFGRFHNLFYVCFAALPWGMAALLVLHEDLLIGHYVRLRGHSVRCCRRQLVCR